MSTRYYEEDARYYPRPAMVAISGGPYRGRATPWQQDQHYHEIPVAASHPGRPLNNCVTLRHSVTDRVLRHVGLGAAREYFGVIPRRRSTVVFFT